MTKTYCDVCGEEIEPQPKWGTGTDIDFIFGMAKIHDICEDCLKASREPEWPTIIKSVIRLYNPKTREQKEA